MTSNRLFELEEQVITSSCGTRVCASGRWWVGRRRRGGSSGSLLPQPRAKRGTLQIASHIRKAVSLKRRYVDDVSTSI